MIRRVIRSVRDRVRRWKIDAIYRRARRAFPEVPEITAEELRRVMREERVVLVDVREPQEQDVSMIEGAMSQAEFEARRGELAGALIVPYCTVGGRSGRYGRLLLAEGWDVRNLRGAILAWTHAGGALVDAAGPTKRVHVWGPKVRLAASGYEAVC
jgi:sodium/bile acid cotransporter 7